MTDPVLFLIPARGSSRRITDKNLRQVAGIPLVAHAVRAATLAAREVPHGPHAVVCSTDTPAIAEVAAAWGARIPFHRPPELASDIATSVDVALHALDELERQGLIFRAIVIMQPTSPLTDPVDVRAAIARFDETGGTPIVSVTESHPTEWHMCGRATAKEPLTPVLAGGARLLLSGAFYIITPNELRRERRLFVSGRTLGFGVPAERSIDVDEETDLAIAEALAAMRAIRTVPIGHHSIGDGRCFVIAEAGVNHNGDPAMAHRLVDAAAEAGADAVKFQTFDPITIARPDAPVAEYQRAGQAVGTQRDLLARLTLPTDVWPALKDHANHRHLIFISSPFDDASARLLTSLNVPAIKVASGELTNLPFLSRLAQLGRPMLVSTGMADMREVAAAVDTIRASGDPPLALLHCVSSYPASPHEANLRAMATLRAAFAVPVGWSDHTPGIEVPIAAVALGAAIVEKHLTLDRSLPGPDHKASLEPASFAAMVAALRLAESALGSGDKHPTPSEDATAAVARRSLHWARDLEPGVIVAEADLVSLRPGTGLAPGRAADIVGRRTGRRVRAGNAVAPTDVEGIR